MEFWLHSQRCKLPGIAVDQYWKTDKRNISDLEAIQCLSLIQENLGECQPRVLSNAAFFF